MKRLSLRCGLLGLLSVLAVSTGLVGPGAAYASTSTIGPATSALIVKGGWQDSKVTIAGYVPSSPFFVNIPISDQSYLRPGWTVMVGSEPMCITSLIDGDPDHPAVLDTMVVQRGQTCDGVHGVSDVHVAGSKVQARTVTFDIYATNITDQYGLGAFSINLTFPPETQYIKAAYSDQWLISTGRQSSCSGPALNGGSYQMECATLPPPDYPLQHGPTGTGLIGSVTVLPPQSLGLTTVSLAGSVLANIVGGESGNLHATISNATVNVVSCPDANLDGKVSVGDQLLVAKSVNSRGVDSGVTLVNNLSSSSTSADITDQALLQSVLQNQTPVVNQISIDAELMTVQQLTEGSPDTMTVSRANQATQAKAHAAGAHIYVATVPGIMGTYNYTRPRDVNSDGKITVGDQLTVAKGYVSLSAQGGVCPAP